MRTATLMILAAALTSGCSVIPQSVAPRKAAVTRSTVVLPSSPAVLACLADLGSKHANFTPLPDQYYGAGCSALNAVRLSQLKSDHATLVMSNLGPVTCNLADTFAGWARFGVDRAAQHIRGSALVKIETLGSYSCRNVAGSEHRSAHASANAIDVSGFVLADGRRITVAGNWADKSPAVQRFFSAIHTSACKRFGLVLSPDYNAAHRNHLHLQVGGRTACH